MPTRIEPFYYNIRMPINPTIASPKSIAPLALLVLAILPIGWIAMWSARNAPMDYVRSEFQNDELVVSMGYRTFAANRHRLSSTCGLNNRPD